MDDEMKLIAWKKLVERRQLLDQLVDSVWTCELEIGLVDNPMTAQHDRGNILRLTACLLF